MTGDNPYINLMHELLFGKSGIMAKKVVAIDEILQNEDWQPAFTTRKLTKRERGKLLSVWCRKFAEREQYEKCAEILNCIIRRRLPNLI